MSNVTNIDTYGVNRKKYVTCIFCNDFVEIDLYRHIVEAWVNPSMDVFMRAFTCEECWKRIYEET